MLSVKLPLVFTRQQALRLGLTDHAIHWRVHTGQWHVLRRGVFCTAAVFAAATPEQRHLLLSLALAVGRSSATSVGAGEAVSHLSAALAFGWPSPLRVDPMPWTTMGPGELAHTRRRHGLVRQVAPLPTGHAIVRFGLTLTSAARTVADCLRHLDAAESVPIADAAIAAGVDVERISRILRWQVDWPYAARGLASMRLVDGRRESWLESRSAVAFHQLDLPAPEPQVSILDPRGRLIARVDHLWTETGVIGESDGWDKYTLPTASGFGTEGDPMARLREEKLREDQLRDLGFEVVRWNTSDALHPEGGLRQRLARSFARARPELVRGGLRGAAHPQPRDIVPAAGLDGLRGLSGDGVLILPAPYARSDGDLASLGRRSP
jgi:hypothetical protein